MLTACLLLGLISLLGASPVPVTQDAEARRATGVVHDTEGRPLSGVRITAKAKLRIVPGSFASELETDAEGRFEFRWTPTGDTFVIQLDFGGVGLSTEALRITTAPRGPEALDLGVIELTRGLPLDLRLEDASGRPLCEGWKVELALGAGQPASARRDCTALKFCLDCVPIGSFTVRVSRSGEPGPTLRTTVQQDGNGEIRTIRVPPRRQIWVRVELPFSEGEPIPASLLHGLSVLAFTTEGEFSEAFHDSTTGLYVLDDLPEGPLELRIEGPSVLRTFEGELPERGLFTARMTGALDLKVVLLEQGSGGRIGRFEVDTEIPGVQVRDVPGDVSKLVVGLVPGSGTLELSVPGANRPHVIVDLAELTAEELAAARVVRTLPNWTALRGRLIDETGRPGDAVSVELLTVDGNGDVDGDVARGGRPAGESRELERGGNYAFAGLVPGPYVLRVRWAERHWQDYPVEVGEQETDLDVRREDPAILDLVFEGRWPDDLGLVVHPCGAPRGDAALPTLRPSSEGRFGPFELAPGEVALSVARHGSGRSWQLEGITVGPGHQSAGLDLSTLPALVCWRVLAEGASVSGACRGDVGPLGESGGVRAPVRLGTTGARKDAMLVEAVDSKLTLTSEDGTWSAGVDLIDLRPGEMREVPVEIARARRRVRLQVDGEPLRNHEFRADVRTPQGVLLRQKGFTDSDGEADLMFVPGVLTIFGVGTGRDPVSLDWSDELGQETLVIELT